MSNLSIHYQFVLFSREIFIVSWFRNTFGFKTILKKKGKTVLPRLHAPYLGGLFKAAISRLKTQNDKQLFRVQGIIFN